MFIVQNVPEQKYFFDIKHVTVTAVSPDLSDSVRKLAYSMLKSFTPQMGITIEEENILVYQWISLSQSVAICRCSNLYANNKLHTFLSKKQYFNIQSVWLLLHVKT